MSEDAVYRSGTGYNIKSIQVAPASDWSSRPPLAIAVGTGEFWQNSDYQYGYIRKQADGTYKQVYLNASGDYVQGGLNPSLDPYYAGAEHHFDYDFNGNGVIDDHHNISIEDAVIREGETKEIKITRSSRGPISINVYVKEYTPQYGNISNGSGYTIERIDSNAEKSDLVYSGEVLNFGHGETTKVISVTAFDDSINEGTEYISIGTSVIDSAYPTKWINFRSRVSVIDNDLSTSSIDSSGATSTTGSGFGVSGTSSGTTSTTGSV